MIDIIARALHAADGKEIYDVFEEPIESWDACDNKGVYRITAHHVLDALREAGYVVIYRPEMIMGDGK
jgi:hypothetical protein